MATVYIYLPDTLADWEIGHISAELYSRRFFRKDAPGVKAVTVSVNGEPIRSMGGLSIIPDGRVSDIEIAPDNMIILPGCDHWDSPAHADILGIVKQYIEIGAGVAAICGATTALAQLGILNNRKHTSNGEGFLEMFCSAYKGSSCYISAPAVQDGNLITAGSTGALLMTKLILQYLKVFRSDTLEYWYEYFSTGNANVFFAMMQSIQ